jgi:hypothetical protein
LCSFAITDPRVAASMICSGEPFLLAAQFVPAGTLPRFEALRQIIVCGCPYRFLSSTKERKSRSSLSHSTSCWLEVISRFM